MKSCVLFQRCLFRGRINFNHMTCSSEYLSKRSMASGGDSSVYEISIKSCGNVYERWRKERKYFRIPQGDIEFKVKYSDTHKNSYLSQSSPLPTLVALHGAPGTCEDYSSLSSFMQQNGVRVVVPSFPDFFTYEPGVFRHSDEEKAQFVRDFLEKLNINQIDTLVVHSSSVYTGLRLCLDNNPLVKSLVMFNPGIHTYNMKIFYGMFFMKLMVITSEIPIVYNLFQMFGPYILRLIRVPLKADNYKDPLLSCTAMVRGNILGAREKFIQLSENRLPMLYAFSDDDKVIGKSGAYSLAHLLGVPNSDIFIYDTNGVLAQEGRETSVLKVISFENGSHYVFWKYADIINSEVKSFMAKL